MKEHFTVRDYRVGVPICVLCFLFLSLFCKGETASGAVSPRQRISLDADWTFELGDAPDAGSRFDYPEVSDLVKTRVDEVGLADKLTANLPNPVTINLGGDVSFVQTSFDDSHWRRVELPHDWVVELPFEQKADVGHGFKPVGPGFPQNNIGWYRRSFVLPASDKGKTLWVEFGGVYRNSLVWLNGHCLGRNVSGYTSFRYDISRFANYGGINKLVVRVDASRFEGWFYEGAGIYRHVWLVKAAPVHVAPDGVFVWSHFQNNEPKGVAEVHVKTRLESLQDFPTNVGIEWELSSPNGASLGHTYRQVQLGSNSVGQVESVFYLRPPSETTDFQPTPNDAVVFHKSVLWSPESPKLYRLTATVSIGRGLTTDRVETQFGIRTVAFNPEKGFLLNGEPYELKGTCNHQDHGGVGTAMPDALQYYRVAKLKEMGANAYRTSHNPPTSELLDACDRLGMLVMDENRRLDTNAETLSQLKSLIVRDRNHPSVFLWSIGNEEKFIQNLELGGKVAAVLQEEVHRLDPTRPVTYAANNGAKFDGINSVIEVRGWNYNLSPATDSYHEQHPEQPNVGTEQGSTVGTRGIYFSDKAAGYVSAYDENEINPVRGGGRTAARWWNIFAARPWLSGGFIWTGFDYRGEPTPYKWPCISSHFGVVDTCGFSKDNFYFYQSWWSSKPVLHLLPHWNWPGREGQDINVCCYSNCKGVELFLNGKSLGRKTMPRNGSLAWTVKYQPGCLLAKGYDGPKLMAKARIETTGEPTAIKLQPERTKLAADERDVSVIEVSVLDERGRPVPTATNTIHFKLTGPGKIIGVGNGDPSDHESDKGSHRRLFSGKAQVLVQSIGTAGVVRLTASEESLKTDSVKLRCQAK